MKRCLNEYLWAYTYTRSWLVPSPHTDIALHNQIFFPDACYHYEKFNFMD